MALRDQPPGPGWAQRRREAGGRMVWTPELQPQQQEGRPGRGDRVSGDTQGTCVDRVGHASRHQAGTQEGQGKVTGKWQVRRR